jgi:hypothetical protein
MRKMKMTKILIQTSILLRTKTLALKVTDRLPYRMKEYKKARQEVHLERATSKMIVRREWVWAWETGKVVVTMSKTKVEVLMSYRKVVVLFKR